MSPAMAQHLYGMINGTYLAVFLLLAFIGISYAFNRRKRALARGYVLIGLSIGLFGLYNLFFQASHGAITLQAWPQSWLWACRFAAPLALMLLTYLVVRITMMRSQKAFSLVEERRWVEYALYVINLLTLLRLGFSESWSDASLVLMLNFIPTALAATMLCWQGIGYSRIGQVLGGLFGVLAMSALAFAMAMFGLDHLPDPYWMLMVHTLYAVVVLTFCFITVRYAYRYTGSMFAIGNYRDFRLAHDMIPSLHHGDFFLMYQPQVNLDTNQVCGLEALIRWQHPVHGLVAPDQFIGLAERCGLIDDLTKWVIHRAVVDLRRLIEDGLHVRISVNFSVKNFNQQLVSYMQRQLQQYQVPPHYLAVEITENLLIEDSDEIREVFGQLADLGVEVALDDYGTGFSSLSYLRKLKLAELKIDRSFVIDLERSDENAVIVRSTLQMSRSLNIRVVAEGVENQRVMDMLRQMNCDVVQGFGIARPMRFADLVAWLQQPVPKSA